MHERNLLPAMTGLADVALSILCIVLLHASFSTTHPVPEEVELVQGSMAVDGHGEEEVILLALTRDGRLAIDGVPVERELSAADALAARGYMGDSQVWIAPDSAVSIQAFLRVHDELRGAGYRTSLAREGGTR